MSEPPVEYSCPYCHAIVQIAAEDAEHVHCPHCGEAFILPQEAPVADTDAELDAQRIQKFAAVRRAAYRSRSYCVIGVGGCVVGAIDLVYHGVRVWGLGRIRASAYIIVAIGLLWGAKHFAVLAAQHHREAKRSALPPPTAPPDFSTLGDGSQIVRDLERM
jgi:DNA-directed RNA polymerase subunit RPC12/RpoP